MPGHSVKYQDRICRIQPLSLPGICTMKILQIINLSSPQNNLKVWLSTEPSHHCLPPTILPTICSLHGDPVHAGDTQKSKCRQGNPRYSSREDWQLCIFLTVVLRLGQCSLSDSGSVHCLQDTAWAWPYMGTEVRQRVARGKTYFWRWCWSIATIMLLHIFCLLTDWIQWFD